MSIIHGIDYGEMIFSKRHEIDKKAYEKYYNDNFIFKNCMLEVDFDDDIIIPVDDNFDDTLTFNSWYGSESHRKYATVILRKEKLIKINKKS